MNEGKLIAKNKDFDYSTVNLETKRKLLTAFVRNDRFSEGALEYSFKAGIIIKILKSMY